MEAPHLQWFSGVSAVDLAVVVLMLFAAWRGYCARLSGQVAGLVGLASFLVTARQVLPHVDAFFIEKSRLSEQGAHTAAFIVTLLVACGVLFVVRLALLRVMQISFTPGFDRWSGVFAGLAKMAVFLALVLALLLVAPHEATNRYIAERTLAGRALAPWVPMATATARRLVDRADAPAEAAKPRAEARPAAADR